jgi:hypothetical protein
LAALGSFSALRLRSRIGNSCQDFSTMTKGDADFLKISVGQVRQDRDVDVVVGKGRRVSLNANVRQPLRDRPSNVRNAPLATVGPKKAACR